MWRDCGQVDGGRSGRKGSEVAAFGQREVSAHHKVSCAVLAVVDLCLGHVLGEKVEYDRALARDLPIRLAGGILVEVEQGHVGVGRQPEGVGWRPEEVRVATRRSRVA